MNAQLYDEVIQVLTNNRKKVSENKRKDYTKGSVDVLANFRNAGNDLGITSLQALGVHLEKQLSAVLNYIKTDGKHESEPIIERIGDSINYLELFYALLVDMGYERQDLSVEQFNISGGIYDSEKASQFPQMSGRFAGEDSKAHDFRLSEDDLAYKLGSFSEDESGGLGLFKEDDDEDDLPF